jgi:hypothetical protein
LEDHRRPGVRVECGVPRAIVQQIEWFETLARLWRLRTVTVSPTKGPEKLGWRCDAAGTMKQQMGAVKRVYDLLLQRTDTRVPEVDGLFASVG